MASATPSSPVIVNLSEYPETAPSICIPRVFSNITWTRVKSVFEELGLGEVDRVDMVKKENEKGESFKRVFVHFKCWASTPEANQCRQKLISGDQVKIVYDEPWFWKISASKVERPEHNTQKRAEPIVAQRTGQRPRVDLKNKTTIRQKPHQVKATRQTQSKQQNDSGNVSSLRKQLDAQRREIQELKKLVSAAVSSSTSVGATTRKQLSRPPTRSRPTIRFADEVVVDSNSGWGQPPCGGGETPTYDGGWGQPSGGVTPTYAYEATSPVYQPTSPVFKPESPKELPESLKINIPNDE